MSHQDALDKARDEYKKFHKRTLAEPTKAERDFIEATQQIKQIERHFKHDVSTKKK